MNRQYVIQLVIVLISFVFAAKLFFLQIVEQAYKIEADNNAVARVVRHGARGIILDRYGKILVSNKPVFDFYIIPKNFSFKDTVEFCQLFGITKQELISKYQKACQHSKHQPSLFLKDVRMEHFAKVKDRMDEFTGLYEEVRTIREYPHRSMANALGYVKEVDKKILEQDKEGYYKPGDLIGRAGIEESYESVLRGKRGVVYSYVDVRRVVKGSYRNGAFDTLPENGKTLISSVDLELQQYGELLMKNKVGSIVAIEPATGEILAMVSSPSYDPNKLTGTGKEVSQNYAMLVNDIHRPLYNRTLMAPYPPGSVFKIVQALIGLQEGVIDTVKTRIPCVQDVVKCHPHPSPLDVKGSIQYSCNPFYHRVFHRIIIQDKDKNLLKDTRIGLTNWVDYLHRFGLGKPLGTDLPNEKAGLVPTVEYYNKKYRKYPYPWRFANIYSLSIGQGEIGVLPIQMANLAAILANRGYYYTPHIIKGIEEVGNIDPKFKQRHETGIKREYFEYIANAMERVVVAGTGRRAFIPDLPICGKTGTAQNPHGEDHSVFIAFAPKYNPKIAIAVYVENAGFGGTWAAPIASLMIEKYLRRTISRKELEEEIMNKDFITPIRKKLESKPIHKVTQHLEPSSPAEQKNPRPTSLPLRAMASPLRND
ncbi:MAG: penicillin-binding transpeptidase domain-containing protein [Cytophagales bacterium]|nr:penicillin-binding transpeptidase domain-containing protein [Bernardetiaceae bacterium]MDW8211306.1 penicillin-binding transpeptidase domain-containing protein [Cytophagales bacterium]